MTDQPYALCPCPEDEPAPCPGGCDCCSWAWDVELGPLDTLPEEG